MTKLSARVGVVLAVSAACLAGWAGETRTWAGGSGNWNESTHWKEGAVPQDGDSVVIHAEESEIAVTNDIEGLAIEKIVLSTNEGADVVAPIILVGKKLRFTSSATAWDSNCHFTNHMELVFAHNVKPSAATRSVNAERGGVFFGDIELEGDFSISGGNEHTYQPEVRGSITGPDSVIWTAGLNSTVHYYGPVRVKGVLGASSWCTYYYKFYASGNSWQTNDLHYGSSMYGMVENAFPTNMVLRWTERRNDGGVENSTYEPNADQTVDRMESAPIADRTAAGAMVEKFLVGYQYNSSHRKLTLRATASASCYAKILRNVSIIYDPLGDFTQTLCEREHPTGGDLIVRRGTLESRGNNTFKSVPRLEVYGQACFKVSANDDGEAVNPFGTVTECVIRHGGTIDVAAGVTVTLKSLLASGVIVPVGIYQAMDGTDANAEKADWVTGEGLVQVLNALPGTCWKAAVNGDWNDATKWTCGVPSADTITYVSADGADYAVNMVGADALPKKLTVANSIGTAKVAVGGAHALAEWDWTVERGGLFEVGSGADVVCDANCVKGATSQVVVNGGGEFRVDGGDMLFTNGMSSAGFTVAGTEAQTGRVTVVSGSLRYVPYGISYFYVNKGGLFDLQGGVFHLPAMRSNQTSIFRQTGGRVIASDGIFRMNGGDRYGWRDFTEGGSLFAGTSVFETMSGFVATVSPGAAGQEAVLTFADSAKWTGTAGIVTIGKCADARAILNFNSSARHGGQSADEGTIAAGFDVGVDAGYGEMNVTDGYVPVYAYGINLGSASAANQSSDGVEGVLKVSGGAVYVRATDNFSGWGSKLVGLIVGAGGYTAVRSGHPYVGRFELSGGAVTNYYGPVILGMGYGRGTMIQSGGRFDMIHPPAYTPSPLVIGMGGGIGRLSMSGGSFVSTYAGKPTYIGGVGLDVFGTRVPDLPSTGYPVDNHTAEGTLSFSGGTFSVAGELVLGADGHGVLERIGTAGTISIGKDLVFSNTVENAQSGGTLRFVLDGDGALSPIAVGGKLVIDSHAKLVVDTGDAEHAKIKCSLVDAVGGIEGDFADGAISFVGASAKDMKIIRRNGSLIAKKSTGMMLILR